MVGLREGFSSAFQYLEQTWLLQVKVPKSILIENWRLALLLRMIQLVIFTSLISAYFVEGRYALYRHLTPTVTASILVDDSALSVQTRSAMERKSDLCEAAFMEHLQYHQATRVYQPQGCVQPLPGDWWQKSDETIFVPTYVQETHSEQTSGLEECQQLMQKCQGERRKFASAVSRAGNGADICRCESVSEFFIRGVGGLKVALQAQYFVANGGAMMQAGNTSHREQLKVVLVEPSVTMNSEHLDEKRTSSGSAGSADVGLLEQVSDSGTNETMVKHDSLFSATSYSQSHSRGRDHRHKLQSVHVGADAHMEKARGQHRHSSAILRRAEEVNRDPGMPSSLLEVERDDSLPKVNNIGTNPAAEAIVGESIIPGKRKCDITVFPNNERIELDIEGWLQRALLIQGEDSYSPLKFLALDDAQVLKRTGSLLDVPNYAAAPDIRNNGSNFRPPFRMTGLELRIRMDLLNHNAQVIAATRSDSESKAKTWFSSYSSKHDALEINVEALPGPQIRPHSYYLEPRDVMTGRAKIVTRRPQGLVIRVVTGGKFSFFSWSIFLSTLTNLLVCYKIPEMLVGGIALYLMGFTSNFYYYIANERIRMKRSLVALMSRVVGWHYIFKLEAESTHKKKLRKESGIAHEEGMTRDMLYNDLGAALKRTFEEEDAFSRMVVKEIEKNGAEQHYHTGEIRQRQPQTSEEAAEAAEDKLLIHPGELTRSAIRDNPFSIAEFEDIYTERMWSGLERFFLPENERRMNESGDNLNVHEQDFVGGSTEAEANQMYRAQLATGTNSEAAVAESQSAVGVQEPASQGAPPQGSPPTS